MICHQMSIYSGIIGQGELKSSDIDIFN